MKIEGNKVNVNKSSEDLYQFLMKPENFKHLMPDTVEVFEADDKGFIFALKGMPKVYLTLGENKIGEFVDYQSAKENIDFNLHLDIKPNGESESTLQIYFEGNFNPFITMMAQKPLTNFVKHLETKATEL